MRVTTGRVVNGKIEVADEELAEGMVVIAGDRRSPAGYGASPLGYGPDNGYPARIVTTRRG
jgi:hypothetical protein